MLPRDPVMLLSFLNTKLRDDYADLAELSEGLDISVDELTEAVERLAQAGYTYDEEQHRFR